MAPKAQQVDFLLSQVRNSTGSLASGTVTFYAAGTTTLKTIWTDRDEATPAANPYTLDANGTAQLYASGLYKVLIKNAAGTTIYTRDNLYFEFSPSDDIDALQYSPFTFTQATIEAALTAIGTTNKVTLLLRPGTWVISSNADWSAYTNVTFKIVPGAILQIATGTTTTIFGPVVDGTHQMFSHVGTGIVRFGPNSIYRFRPEMWGAVVDNSTNDGPAINAMFASARASRSFAGAYVEFPPGLMLTNIGIDAGGFGNYFLKITGSGRYSGGSGIRGAFAGCAVLDSTWNENIEIDGIQIEGDSVITPDVGILMGQADIGGAIRGGNLNLHHSHIHGHYNVAAYYQWGTDLNHIHSNYIGAGGTGVAIALSTSAVKTLPITSDYYTLGGGGGGTTTHRQSDNVISLAGTGRTFQFIEGLTSVYSSYGDTYQVGGTASGKPVLEIIKSGQSFNIHDVRSENAGNAPFIKTDGFGRSTITGTVQSSADLTTPLIDVSAAYGSGDGYVSGSYIRLSPSGVGGYLFNTTGDGGINANIIQVMSDNSILVNGTLTTAGNFISNLGAGTITLNAGNSDDDGNIILSRTGLQMNGGTGGGTGAALKNHLSGTVVWNPGTVNAGVTTTTDVTVTGAAVGDPVMVGLTTLDEAGWMFSGQVRVANTVSVTLTNTTGGNITVPNGGTLRASVMKY